MIIESMSVEGLYIISLALSNTEKWQAARNPFSKGSKTEVIFTVLAVVALILSEALLFWVFNKYRHSEQKLNQKNADLTVANIKLRQENDKSTDTIEKLQQELEQLKTTNEKLQQENSKLKSSVEVA